MIIIPIIFLFLIIVFFLWLFDFDIKIDQMYQSWRTKEVTMWYEGSKPRFAPLGSGKDKDRQRNQMLNDWWEQAFEEAVGAKEVRETILALASQKKEAEKEIARIQAEEASELRAVEKEWPQRDYPHSHNRESEYVRQKFRMYYSPHQATINQVNNQIRPHMGEYKRLMLLGNKKELPEYVYHR